MYNVIIWGTGYGYNHHFNLIKYLEIKGEISVKGVISDDKEINDSIDGYKFYPKTEIHNVDFDYCIVTILDFDSVKAEAETLGISITKLIPVRVLEIPYFNFERYIRLKEKGVTIISRNCWAGICYHYLALEFRSPTINLFFNSAEFIKFVSNMDYYLSLPIEFAKLPFKNKLIFVPKKMNITNESSFALNFEEKENGETIGMYCNNSANGKLSLIDLLAFLNQEDYIRVK